MKNLSAFILILVSIGVFFFLIEPKTDEIKILQAEITENNKTLDLGKKLSDSREDLREKYKNISESERERLEKLLPNTIDNVRLIIDIQNIADRKQIEITNFVIGSKAEENIISASDAEFEGIIEKNELEYPDESKIGVLTFSFSVSTTYDNFNDFLMALEESLRLVDIRSIEISGGDVDSVFYNYRVTLETYWLK